MSDKTLHDSRESSRLRWNLGIASLGAAGVAVAAPLVCFGFSFIALILEIPPFTRSCAMGVFPVIAMLAVFLSISASAVGIAFGILALRRGSGQRRLGIAGLVVNSLVLAPLLIFALPKVVWDLMVLYA